MGPLLFDFPRTIVISILAQWLPLEDLGRLDSSVSNSDARPQFLGRITDEFFVSCGTDKELSVNYFRWLKQRRLKVSCLKLNCTY